MKKALIVFLAVMMMSSMAYAGLVKQNCGCGIGTMAFGDKDGLVFHILATTTNGICGNQTFGVTFGTLDCQKAPTIVMIERLNIFVADNMDSLAVDIASGQGESLDTLAEISQVPSDKKPELYAALQQNFDTIYASADTTNEQVVVRIVSIIEKI